MPVLSAGPSRSRRPPLPQTGKADHDPYSCHNNPHDCCPSVPRSCRGRPMLANRQPTPCRPGFTISASDYPPHSLMPTIHRPTPFVRAADPAPTIQPSTENSIKSRWTYAPHRVQSNRVSASATRCRTLNSLALASLNLACRNLVPAFPQRSPPLLLTTAACGGLRSTPDCRPRRALLHLSYSCAPSHSDGARDTRPTTDLGPKVGGPCWALQSRSATGASI